MTRCPHEPRDLYEINTRVWLASLGAASLDQVPDAAIEEIAQLGFDLVWLMGVWAPSPCGARLAAAHQEIRAQAQALRCDGDGDIVASPYALVGYEPSPLIGGAAALSAFRRRLKERGLQLVLDFVPNHTAVDHPWVAAYPERYVAAPAGSTGEAFASPSGAWLYHGRDPHFPPWTDTAQLDFRKRGTREAVVAELLRAASFCDGLRCDMAMLLLPEVFAATWRGKGEGPSGELEQAGLWPAALDAVRRVRPDFLFLAEAYWGTERRLLHLGFDGCYDKALYDLLLAGDAAGVRAHLEASRPWQRHLVRFLENHDEERAAAVLPEGLHRAAALLALTLPGVRLVHQGQLDGARHRLPVQLARAPREQRDPAIAGFYAALLRCLRDPALRLGELQLLSPLPAWAGNPSHEAFVVHAWEAPPGQLAGGHRLLVANLAGHRAQCRVKLQLPGLGGRTAVLTELLAAGAPPPGDLADGGPPVYRRDGDELAGAGLFLDLAGHTAQLLSVTAG